MGLRQRRAYPPSRIFRSFRLTVPPGGQLTGIAEMPVAKRISGRLLMAAGFAGLLAATTPVRADVCDEQAKTLASQIDGLKIGKARGGVIALEHPAVSRASLGCSARNITNEIFAATESRKPSDQFYDFVASATAIIFAIPKPDALRGAQRCAGRVGIIRGNDIETRYRRLDIRCIGTKTELSISISREKDNDG
jgi:hypothetical protein